VLEAEGSSLGSGFWALLFKICP